MSDFFKWCLLDICEGNYVFQTLRQCFFILLLDIELNFYSKKAFDYDVSIENE